MDCIKNFHHSLALKLETTCNKVVHVLHTCLVPCPSSIETVVYHKMYALFLLLLLNALTSLSWFLSLFWLMRLCWCWFHVWRCILVTVYAQDRGREDKLCWEGVDVLSGESWANNKSWIGKWFSWCNCIFFTLFCLKVAYTAAEALPPADPERLSIFLNLSTFWYDVMRESNRFICVSVTTNRHPLEVWIYW